MPHFVHKNIGETPLEALERFRAAQMASGSVHSDGRSFDDLPMTYAGRLDPMAEGVLVILVGEECKDKQKYLSLNKTYEVEVVFGISTDTHDALGLASIKSSSLSDNVADIETPMDPGQCRFIGKDKKVAVLSKPLTFMQKYPAYSSMTIGGVQLHQLARRGQLPDSPDGMPEKGVTIYSICELGRRVVSDLDLLQVITERVALVRGDFRQKEIIERWRSILVQPQNRTGRREGFEIVSIRVECSSGTYMRSLADRMGIEAGTGAFALSIRRTCISPIIL